MKRISTYLAYFICSLSVISCGGGEDESSAPPPVTPEVPEITTDDLISNNNFDFYLGYNLTINLNALETTALNYHINVCSQFSKQDEVYLVEHQSCRLRAIYSGIEQEFTVTIGAAETELIAQIWPMTDNASPINLFWQKANHGNTWQIDYPNP